jgi:hypothetical protein
MYASHSHNGSDVQDPRGSDCAALGCSTTTVSGGISAMVHQIHANRVPQRPPCIPPRVQGTHGP